MMNKIKEIRFELKDMCDAEANKLWRLRRNLIKRGLNPCDQLLIDINEEAIELYNTGYPERILTKTYKYAFKY